MIDNKEKTSIETPSRSKIFKAYIERKKEQEKTDTLASKKPHLKEDYSSEKE